MPADQPPAAVLREAAQLMREFAEAAAPGPWTPVDALFSQESFGAVVGSDGDAQDPETWIVGTGRRPPGSRSYAADVQHIASWHPLVALAVADLLEREAGLIDAQVFPRSDPVMERYPLAVARAYLGREVPGV